MNRTRIYRIIGGAAAGAAGLLGVYLKLVRPKTMRWRATDEEAARPLPGDRGLHPPMPEEVADHASSLPRRIIVTLRPEPVDTAHQMPPRLTRS
jgi:hypothetical protein